MIIKFLLIAAAFGLCVLVLRESSPGRHLLLRRIAGLAVVGMGVVAVLWPLITTRVANAIGVGRGTDLVLYVLVVVFTYSAIANSQRVHHLEHQITLLVRELALQRVQTPTPADPALDSLDPSQQDDS